MGPGAGEKGGEIVYSGDVKGIFKEKNSVTGQYLSGKKKIPIPDKRLQGDGKKIVLKNPRANNLRIDTVEFPLGCIVSVTGVSGSGKSTLINEVLFNGLAKMHSGYEDYIKNFEKLTGYHYISKVEMIDQSSIGKSSRSTPVTYTGVFDYIRDLFANTQQAKQLGLSSSYFSFIFPAEDVNLRRRRNPSD
jgi:excinuclease ABC subunit A